MQEKRQGKMTVARALDSENVRVRSLASIKGDVRKLECKLTKLLR